ncbi:MAG TPA: hypothetical protein VGD74_04145, partial [Vulgatibacter sp.]
DDGANGTIQCPPGGLDEVHVAGDVAFGVCADGTHFLDLRAGRERAFPGTSSCEVNPQGTAALCKWTDDATAVELHSVDLVSGHSTNLGPWEDPAAPITWSPDGRHAQIPLILHGWQVRFGTGGATMQDCAAGYQPIAVAIGDGGVGLWQTDTGLAALCGQEGISPLPGTFVDATAIERTGWWWVEGTSHLVSLDGGDPIEVSSGYGSYGPVGDGSIAWFQPGDGSLLALSAGQVTEIAPEGSGFPLGLGSKNGLAIRADDVAVLFDLEARTTTTVASGVNGYWYTEDGGLLLFSKPPSGELQLTFAHPERGTITTIAGPGDLVDEEGDLFLWNGFVYLNLTKNGEWGFYRVSTATGARTRLIADGEPVLGSWVDETGNLLQQGDRTWFERDGSVFLVHGLRNEVDTPLRPHGLLFWVYEDPSFGIHWMALP